MAVIDPGLLEDFRTIAEVAVTIAGFAAIAGVIERTRGQDVSAAKTSALISLLGGTLPVLILALLPAWLSRGFDSAEVVWRVCFGVSLLQQVVAFSMFYASRGVAGRTEGQAAGIKRLSWALSPIGLTYAVISLACVLGFFSEYYAFVYHGGLVFLVLTACVSFAYLVALGSQNSAIAQTPRKGEG